MLRLVQFLKMYISQGTVATRAGCGGIFNNTFIANSLQSVPVKEFWRSAENWQSYRHEQQKQNSNPLKTNILKELKQNPAQFARPISTKCVRKPNKRLIHWVLRIISVPLNRTFHFFGESNVKTRRVLVLHDETEPLLLLDAVANKTRLILYTPGSSLHTGTAGADRTNEWRERCKD